VLGTNIGRLAIAMLFVAGIFLCSGCAVNPPATASAPDNTTSLLIFPTQNPPMASGTTLKYTKPGKVANTGELLSFKITATDADNDPLDYSASDLPDGATFDPGTRTFSWTPRYDQAGEYTVRFEVSDGTVTESEDVTIIVVQLYPDWDINGDNFANVLDMVMVGQHWGEFGLTGWIREDANEDGEINVLDIIIIGQNWSG
jgi:hypothetical protein